MKTFAIVMVRVFGTWIIMIFWIRLFTMLTSSEFKLQLAATVSVVCTLAAEIYRIETRKKND